MRRFGLLLLAIGFVGGAVVLITFYGSEQEKVSPTEEPAAERQRAEDLAADLGCGGVEELSYFNAPIRGGAATRGVMCNVSSAEVHIFERAPLGDFDPEKSYAVAQGGSLENIDRLIGTEAENPCLSLLLGATWFIVANDEQILKQAEDRFGGAERPILRGTPSASYVGPGGCGNG